MLCVSNDGIPMVILGEKTNVHTFKNLGGGVLCMPNYNTTYNYYLYYQLNQIGRAAVYTSISIENA